MSSRCVETSTPSSTSSTKTNFNGYATGNKQALTGTSTIGQKQVTHFFHKQIDFPSEPGVANEILENEPEICLAFA